MGRPGVEIIIVDGIPTKGCPGCGKIKSLSSFVVDWTKTDNRTSHCKDCRNEYTRKWLRDRPGARRRYNQKYRLAFTITLLSNCDK